MANTVIKAGIAYSFNVVSYSILSNKELEKKITPLQKIIYGLPNCTPKISIKLPQKLFGMQAFSLKNAYLQCIGLQPRDALNDLSIID